MRIKTPINRQTIKDHMTYSVWKYALMAACVIFGWSLIYTTTAYRSPQNKRVDVYIQSSTTSKEIVDAFMEPIWKETVPDMEIVSSVVLVPLDEASTSMQLMTYLAAGEGDIYFLQESYFKNLASAGFFLPLEDLIADQQLDVSDIDLSKGYVTYVEEYDENDRPVKTANHLYGIPLETFYGFMSNMQMDNRGLYAVITVTNHNDENVKPFFNALLQAGRGEKEAWITEYYEATGGEAK